MSALGDKLRIIAADLDQNEDIRGIAIVAAGEIIYEVTCEDDELDDEQAIDGLLDIISDVVGNHPVGSLGSLTSALN